VLSIFINYQDRPYCKREWYLLKNQNYFFSLSDPADLRCKKGDLVSRRRRDMPTARSNIWFNILENLLIII